MIYLLLFIMVFLATPLCAQGYGSVERGRRAIQQEWQEGQREARQGTFWVFRDGGADLYQSGNGRARNWSTGAWGFTTPGGNIHQYGGERDGVLNDLLMQERDER